MDYMANVCLSTPALRFTLTHWQINLGDEHSKDSAGVLVEDSINSAIGRGEYVMMLEDQLPCGCFSTSGPRSHIQHGSITNCSQLDEEFPVLGSALRRSQYVSI